MPWIRRKLRDSTVYVRVTSDGQPAAGQDGRVDIKYKPDPGSKIYRAAARNLKKTGRASDEKPIELAQDGGSNLAEQGSSKQTSTGGRARSSRTRTSDRQASVEIPEDAIVIYTDGACTGNPGPAGIGVVIMDGDKRQEVSEYLGVGTNNIAELTAIGRALEEVADQRERPVFVHTDSSYSIGLLAKGWKAKANAELVERLRALTRRFPLLQFVKVKGHAGIPENERADELARDAITQR